MSRTSAPTRLAALVALATLMACGAPTPPSGDPDPQPQPQEQQRVAGTASAFGSAVPVSVGITMSVLRDTTVPDDELRLDTASTSDAWPIVGVGSGLFVGAFVPLDTDGGFELGLPAADAIPEAVLETAETFVHRVNVTEDCSLVASDPTARVTGAYGFLDALIDSGDDAPVNLAFQTVNLVALGTNGLLFAYAAVDPVPTVGVAGSDDDPIFPVFVTWVHAERALDASSVGACVVDGLTIDVDVQLAAGWNQLTWALLDGGRLELRSRDGETEVSALIFDLAELIAE